MKTVASPLSPAFAIMTLAAALLAAPVSTALAETVLVVLVEDRFDNITIDGSGPEQTVTSGPCTYRAVHGSIDNFIGSGSGHLAVAGHNFNPACLAFTPVTLTRVGDYIEVTFKITYPSGAPDRENALRFGLYDTSGDLATALSTTENEATGDSAKGYFLSLNPGSDDAAGVTLSRDRGDGSTVSGAAVNGGNGMSTIAQVASNAFGSAQQEVAFRISKTSTGVNLSGRIAGSTFSEEENVSKLATFDTFVFGNGNGGAPWLLDDLVISSNVPR